MITVGDDNRVQLFNVTSSGDYELATTMAGKKKKNDFLVTQIGEFFLLKRQKCPEMPTFLWHGIIHQKNLLFLVRTDRYMYGIFEIGTH
jgi:hypothetical protein